MSRKNIFSKERVIMVHLHKTQGLTLWHLLKSKNESWGKSHFFTANDQQIQFMNYKDGNKRTER